MRYLAGLCAALSGRGHEAHVLAADAGPLGRTVQRQGITVHPMGHPWPFRHYEADADALLKANQLLGEGLKLGGRTGSFDAVCFQGWETCLPALALCERLGVPAVCLMHRVTAIGSTPPLDEGARYRAEMESWACERAALIVCPSRIVASELVGRCEAKEGKVVVVPPACDLAFIDPGHTNLPDFRSLFAGPEDLAVLFACSLTPDNAPGALLHALPQVLEHIRAVRAVFAGDGPLAEELMQDAERLGVADHCLFTGPAAPCVLAALYRTCDVLVAPAIYAPSGIGAVEAQAAGLPVVASDTGALTEIIHDGRNGIRVPPGDPDGLAAALIWLSARRERLNDMRKCALAASTGWTWDMAVDRFTEAVENAVRPATSHAQVEAD